MTLDVAVRGDEDVVAAAADVAVVESLDSAAVLVAVGQPALASLAADPPSTPVLPVDVDAGPYAVTHHALSEALSAVAAGAYDEMVHPVVAVACDGDVRARALFDVGLLTSEPARISEYAVYDGFGRVDEFRADGVVTATPLGSGGYARAAGGPVLAPDTGFSVVPVSPYSTQSDTWVLSPDVGFSVERDDSPVTLFADGADVCPVAPGTRVTVSPVDSITVLTPTRE